MGKKCECRDRFRNMGYLTFAFIVFVAIGVGLILNFQQTPEYTYRIHETCEEGNPDLFGYITYKCDRIGETSSNVVDSSVVVVLVMILFLLAVYIRFGFEIVFFGD